MDHDDRWCAVLSYVFIGLVWYALHRSMRRNSFVTFHALQALWLWIAAVVLQLLAGFISFLFFLWIVAAAALFVFALTGMFIALEGRKDTVLPG